MCLLPSPGDAFPETIEGLRYDSDLFTASIAAVSYFRLDTCEILFEKGRDLFFVLFIKPHASANCWCLIKMDLLREFDTRYCWKLFFSVIKLDFFVIDEGIFFFQLRAKFRTNMKYLQKFASSFFFMFQRATYTHIGQCFPLLVYFLLRSILFQCLF